MTRLRRARLAGALVALGTLLCPELPRDSSFSALFFNYRSFRPRSLISPAAAGQVEKRFGSGKLAGQHEMTTEKIGNVRRFNDLAIQRFNDIIGPCIGLADIACRSSRVFAPLSR